MGGQVILSGKRFNDLPYSTFSIFSKMVVVCPECGKAGTVCYNKERKRAVFQCGFCYRKEEMVPGEKSGMEVTAQCTSTGKYIRILMPAEKIHGQKVRFHCPYCKEFVIGNVEDMNKPRFVVFEEIRNASDPYFHYSFYFKASFRGKTIWALNRQHLQYLIDYLSADIRTVQPDFYETYKTMRSQSDVLPTFMKTAKNREGIVKALKKLVEK